MTLYLQHPVLFQAPIDRPARDAERRRRGLLVVLVKRQGPQDQLLFDLGELWDGAARLGDRRRLAGGEAGQVGEGDLLARAHREGALDEILELAHVAGEVVRLERGEGVGRGAADLPAEAATEASDEVVRERRDVLAPRAERGQAHAHHVEAVVQVLAQLALRDRPLEVPVRRRDHPHVDRVRLGRADGTHLHLLEYAQELDLQPRRELGDLIEEDRPLVGATEESERVRDGAREGAADVTEELGLQEVLWDRAAVHGDERPLGARREAVDRRRDELLAGATLALDEHRGVGRSDLRDDLLHALHGRRVADQLVDRQLLAQTRPSPGSHTGSGLPSGAVGSRPHRRRPGSLQVPSLPASDSSTTGCQTDKVLVRPLSCAVRMGMLALTLTFY